MSRHNNSPKASKNVETNEVNDDVDPQSRWLQIDHIKRLSEKGYPTLPLGVDNIHVNIDRSGFQHDFGSIIAHVMTSHRYVDEVMGIHNNPSSSQE